MANLINKITSWWQQRSDRSRLAIKNILVSVIVRLFTILVSLAIIPLTISYLDPTRYGIWMTISTMIVCLSYFDMGLANGFRNRYAEAKAKNDLQLARQYVSTTYFLISLIMGGVAIIISLVAPLINWAELLNIDSSYNDELHKVVVILVMVFCVNLIVNIFTKLLIADQLPAGASIITFVGQLFSLVAIVLLKQLAEGSLILLAFFFSSVPPLLTLIVSMIMFHTKRYRDVRPSWSHINLKLGKSIIGIGIKFFVIQIMLVVIVQLINLIISRNVGPIAVTQYNVAYKYFSILLMLAGLIMAPFWSAYTDAYSRKDYCWMRSTITKIDRYAILMVVLAVLFIFCSDLFFRLWVGSEVEIPINISVAIAVFCLLQTTGFVYMNVVNGLGKVQIQMCIFISFGLIAFPAMSYLCRNYGIVGVVVVPSLTYLLQTIFLRLQIQKILDNKASGFWNK